MRVSERRGGSWRPAELWEAVSWIPSVLHTAITSCPGPFVGSVPTKWTVFHPIHLSLRWSSMGLQRRRALCRCAVSLSILQGLVMSGVEFVWYCHSRHWSQAMDHADLSKTRWSTAAKLVRFWKNRRVQNILKRNCYRTPRYLVLFNWPCLLIRGSCAIWQTEPHNVQHNLLHANE